MRGLKGFLRAQIIALVVMSTGVGGIAWRTLRQSPAPVGVVIITLDTTRADRLPVYGFMDAAMPHLDRLAREGVVFDRATSVAPLTLPAHCSLFTGLFPPAHGVRDNSDRPLSPHHTTLAETLRGRGFRTAGFVGSVVLDADRGLAQGFDHYGAVVEPDESNGPPGPPRRRRGDKVVTDAIRWIEGVHDSPFFVWAHLYDPHRPVRSARTVPIEIPGPVHRRDSLRRRADRASAGSARTARAPGANGRDRSRPTTASRWANTASAITGFSYTRAFCRCRSSFAPRACRLAG